MERPNNLNSKAVNAFTTGSLVILGLFVVLSYGFAALVLLVGKDIISHAECLIWILAFSTPIFLGVGFGLVARLHKKYYIGGQKELSSETPKGT